MKNKSKSSSIMAQLVNRGHNPCGLAVLLPSIVSNAILQRERASAIAGIAAKD